jgi:hypothetical protein
MRRDHPFFVIDQPALKWPSNFRIPTKHFRLFIAANTADIPSDVISKFIEMALQNGMVYLCVWGAGCSRFHDIADLVIVQDELGKRSFVGPNQQDTIMTTWHEEEALEDAVEYFVMTSHPTEGYLIDSNYWLAISLGNNSWATTIQQYLEQNIR